MYTHEPISKRPLSSDICVPDERDLRFALTGLNFNPRNTQCIPPVNPPEADRLPRSRTDKRRLRN
jgi:hypothetical protein